MRKEIKSNNELNLSMHAMKRISLRKISKTGIKTCINYGKVLYKTGIKFYILLEKTIKEFNLDRSLEGICVLVSHDNVILTVYKNKKVSRKIKTLTKRSRRKNYT